MVLVKKKEGTLRLCVDYHRINAVSATDAYLLPKIDDIIHQIEGAKYLTTIDLMKGYWQIPVASSDQCKTDFCTSFWAVLVCLWSSGNTWDLPKDDGWPYLWPELLCSSSPRQLELKLRKCQFGRPTAFTRAM